MTHDEEVELAGEAYKLHKLGVHLTDQHVQVGAKVMPKLARDLRAFGSEFYLAANELMLVGRAFEQYHEFRKSQR